MDLKEDINRPTNENVLLRTAQESDIALLHEWFSSVDAFGEFDQPFSSTVEQTRQLWESGLSTSLRMITFNNEAIGFTDTNRNSSEITTARITVIIAVAKYRSRGIGTIAHRLLCEEIFKSNSNVLTIEAWTDKENKGEQKVLQRVGFVQKEVLENAWKLREAHRDMIIYRLERDSTFEQI